ncbi:NADPH-dependent F420 reductase [Streptomyces sp. NPDC002926]
MAIPFRNVLQIPVQPLASKIVIDANNYFAPRDGQVPANDNGDTAASEMLAAHLTGTRVVKAFNAIMAAHIVEHARPSGAPHRRAISIAGDDDQAKRAVTEFIDQIGFDVVDRPTDSPKVSRHTSSATVASTAAARFLNLTSYRFEGTWG